MHGFLRKHWRKIVLAAIGLPITAYLGLCLIIGLGVHRAVSNAQAHFPGDPVTALESVATSANASLSDRNRAIWALGQLGSPEALPVLQSLVTGEPCDHETKICQHDVESAIAACSGGVNIGAVIWRHGDLAVKDKNGI